MSVAMKKVSIEIMARKGDTRAGGVMNGPLARLL
jgi:hypothetical protein